MASLIGCLNKAGKLLSREDRDAILEAASYARQNGVDTKAAARAAVMSRLRSTVSAVDPDQLRAVLQTALPRLSPSDAVKARALLNSMPAAEDDSIRFNIDEGANPNDPPAVPLKEVKVAPVVEGQVTDNPKNVHGLMPYLRVKADVEIPPKKKARFVGETDNKNAPRQIAAIDEILDAHPDAMSSPENWARMMADALATNDVPVPPYAFIRDLNGDGSLNLLKKLTPGQIEDADHGFKNAAEFRLAYTSGKMKIGDTGRLFLWSFLSRGVSPYTQESLFIDSFYGITPWFEVASRGRWSDTLKLPLDRGTKAEREALADSVHAIEMEDYLKEMRKAEKAGTAFNKEPPKRIVWDENPDGTVNLTYSEWARTAAPRGSGQPGAGATHNLNAFGNDFLRKMSMDAGDGSGRSRLQVIHDMMSDPNATGKQVRRKFLEMGEGVGIDNKVVSFTLLVAGFNDIMVLDRVQIRQLWNDGRFKDVNLYDGFKVDKKVVTGSALSEITYGARGLLIYEAIERALANKIKDIYTKLGRPEAGSIGRYHWETWVASSEQEASHGTIDAILTAVKGSNAPLAGVTAKEGEYGAYAYGARYGRDGDNKPYFLYSVPDRGDYRFTVGEFQAFLDAIKKAKNGVIPKGDFKVTEAGNAPWFRREGVNLDRLAAAAGEYGARIDVPRTDAGNVAGKAVPDRYAADRPSGAAAGDDATGAGTGSTADAGSARTGQPPDGDALGAAGDVEGRVPVAAAGSQDVAARSGVEAPDAAGRTADDGRIAGAEGARARDLIEGQPGSATTQIATTVGSYQKAADQITKLVPSAGKILDYGAGLGLGSDAMRAALPGVRVDSLEPFPQRWRGAQPPTFTAANAVTETYDGVVSLNVLNVLQPDLRARVARDIMDRIAPGGAAVIGVRKFKGDVDGAKGARAADEPGAVWISRNGEEIYQKGFDGSELVDYLKSIAPEGYVVERGSGIAANTAIIRNTNTTDQNIRFRVEDTQIADDVERAVTPEQRAEVEAILDRIVPNRAKNADTFGNLSALPDAAYRMHGIDPKSEDLSKFKPVGQMERTPHGVVIRIAAAIRNGDELFPWVARHESIHALKALGLFTPREWQILTTAATKLEWTSLSAKGRFLDVEEAIAEAFAAWGLKATKGDKPLRVDGKIERIFSKVKNFYKRLVAAMTGKGRAEWEDIFAAIERGDIGRRDPGKATMQQDPTTYGWFPKNDLFYAGETRGAVDAALQVDTPAFKRWFGDSKAVDKKGNPLVVYHGSPSKDPIDIFKTDNAAFFSSKSVVAEEYTAPRGLWRSRKTGAVTPAYLSMKNPLIIDAMGKRHNNIPVPWQRWSPTTYGNVPRDAVSVYKAAEYARANGYDGLIVRNVIDTADINDRVKSDVFAVFSPEQIKSATNNSGAFDPQNPDIRFRVDNDPAAAAFMAGRKEQREAFLRELGLSPKATKAEALAFLAKREERDLTDIETMRDMIRGTHRPDRIETNYARVARAANMLNYTRLMGGVVIASMGDVYRPAMVHGIAPYISQGLPALLRMLTRTRSAGQKLAREEARLAGLVAERVLQERLSTFAELSDPFREGTAIERLLQNATKIGSRWNGILLWTDAMQEMTSIMSQNRILRALRDGGDDTYLAYLGIGARERNLFARDLAKVQEIDGVMVANTEKWQSEEARRLFRAALGKDVDSIIVKKGVGDTPLFASTPTGKLVLQFKTFALASHQKVLLRGLSENQARFISGVVGMTIFGMLATYLRAVATNRTDRLSENPAWWIGEGLDVSGIFAIPFEIANTSGKVTGYNPVRDPLNALGLAAGFEGDQRSLRYDSRGVIGSLAGPSAGLVEDAATITNAAIAAAASGGETNPRKAQINAATRMVPFYSYPGMRQFMEYLAKPALYEAAGR